MQYKTKLASMVSANKEWNEASFHMSMSKSYLYMSHDTFPFIYIQSIFIDLLGKIMRIEF